MAIDIVPLLLGLASGAVGGNVAGALMKSGMGTLGRSITGVAGGTGLSLVTQMLGIGGVADPTAGASLNASSILTNVGSGVAGGGILTAILGMLKK